MKRPTQSATDAARSSPTRLRSLLQRFAVQFLPGAVLIGATTALVAYLNARSTLEQFRDRERVHAEVGASAPAARLRHALDDVRLLGLDEAIRAGELTDDDEVLARLARRFIELAGVTGRYDQVRWIDERGQERLRIDYANGRAQRVAESALQDKSDRYYFGEAVALPLGAIYVSPLDLNIEDGQIEQPYKPMVRIATPVAARDGTRRGVVVVNYLAEEMLERIVAVVGDSRPRLSVVNQAGDWLYSPDPARNWGFMFDRPQTLARHHPAAWRSITATARGQALLNDGLWTWAKVDLDFGDAADNAHVQLDLRVVLHADSETLWAVQREGVPALLAGTLVILLAYAALSARLARTSLAREASEARAARLHAEAQASAGCAPATRSGWPPRSNSVRNRRAAARPPSAAFASGASWPRRCRSWCGPAMPRAHATT
jgi:hypothetical protein